MTSNYKILTEHGVKESAVPFDPRIADANFISLPHCNFLTQDVTPAHHLFFYSLKTHLLTVGYRETTDAAISDFQTIYSTGFHLADCSFLTTANAIHSVLIIRTLFGSRLVYRKRGENGFEDSLIIYEGVRASDCSLFLLKDELHVTFFINNSLYITTSSDFKNFSPPKAYKQKLCKEPQRVGFTYNRSNLFCREAYIDPEKSSDIQILPDLVPNFSTAAAPVIIDDVYDPFKNFKQVPK